MDPRRKLFIMLILLNIVAQSAMASSWVVGLKQIAVALGWIMMVIMGIKWMTADSASDRADAKKGMLYIVIGLLLVAAACNLLCIYCCAAKDSIGTNVCTATSMSNIDCGGVCAAGCLTP